jgi:hypothetical protein
MFSGHNSVFSGLSSALRLSLSALRGRRFDFFLDNISSLGSDSNSGTSSSSPFLTLAHAVAATPANKRLGIARGSRLFERLTGVASGVSIGDYGSSTLPQPSIEGGRLIVGAWVQDGAAWHIDVTHTLTVQAAASLNANMNHFMLWDERAQGIEAVTAMAAYWGGATQADNIAYVKANQGAFTCYRTGSAAADPRLDATGQTFTYYVRLSDDANPNTVGSIYYAEQQINIPPNDGSIDGITFGRCSSKDCLYDAGNALPLRKLNNYRAIDCAIHGAVAAPFECRNYYSRPLPSSRIYGGGGITAYHSQVTFAETPGVNFYGVDNRDCSSIIFFHGEISAAPVHKYVNAYNIIGTRANNGIAWSQDTEQGVIVDGFTWTLIRKMVGGTTVTLKNGTFTTPTDSNDCYGFDMAGNQVGEHLSLTFQNNTANRRFLYFNDAAQLASNAVLFYTLTLRYVTNIGGYGPNGNTYWNQVDLVVEDSDLGELCKPGTEATVPFHGMTATRSKFSVGGRTLATLQASYPGIDSTNGILGIGVGAAAGSSTVAGSSVSTATDLLAGETDGYAASFRTPSTAARFAKKTSSSVTTYASVDDFFTHTATAPQQVNDATGAAVWAAHNLLTKSETFDTWGLNRLTVTTDATVAPDGTSTMDAVFETAVSNTHHADNAGTFAGDNCLSVYFKKLGRQYVCTDLSGASARAVFDLDGGAVASTFGSDFLASTAAIQSAANGSWRCWFGFNKTVTTSARVFTNSVATDVNNVSYLGDVTKGVYAWGAQVNKGTTPTAYLKTTGAVRYGVAMDAQLGLQVLSSVTNAPNFATSSVPWSAAAGTIWISAKTPSATGTNVLWQADGGSAANRFRIYRDSSNHIHCVVTVSSVDQADIDLGAVADSTDFQVTFGWAANDFAASLNGGAVLTDVSGTLPTVTTIRHGYSATGEQWGGSIYGEVWKPAKVANADLPTWRYNSAA